MQYVEQPVTWCEMWRVDMSLESAHTTRVHGPCLRHALWTSEQVHGCYHFGIRVPSTREHGHCPTMLFQHGRCSRLRPVMTFTGSVYRASRRRAAGAELGEGIRRRRRSEDGVFQLQLTVSRRQVLNLLLQQLDFLAHSEQQVTLHQILRRQQPEYTYFILFYFSNHFILAPRSCKIK